MHPARFHLRWGAACGLVGGILAASVQAQPVAIETVAFHKATYSDKYGAEGGSIDTGGTLFLQLRNQGAVTETVTNLLLNGVGVTNHASFRWWRVWPPSLPPGGVSTITVKATGAPLTEGGVVTNLVQFASGASVTATATLTTPALRLGSVLPSRDYRTLHLYVRNLDSVPCTIQSVFVNGDVTGQCTFVGGTTIPTNSIGLVKVVYANPLPELADLFIRVNATRSGGGTVTVAAPVKLIEPWFPIGTWSGSLADTPSRQQFVRSNLLDMVAGTPNSGNINTMAERYHIRPVTFANTTTTPRTADPAQVLPNVGNRNLRAWFIRDEPDINSVSSAEVAAHHLAFAQLDSTHPTYLNLAANRRFNEYGHISDIIGMDHYAAFSAPNIIPSTWVTRKASLEEALDYTDVLKANTEPKRMWVWPQGIAGVWSTQPRDWAIDLQFWMAIQGGAKGYFWFTYKDNEVDLSPAGFAAMQRATRKLAQVRNLLLYADVVDNVASSNNKLIARSIVGEDAVVVPVVNVNYSIGGLAFAPSYSLSAASGTLTVPVPPWLAPVAQVYEVTENGKVPVSYTPAGSAIQIAVSLGNTASNCSKVFVLGALDATPPGTPARLNVANLNPVDAAALSWEEPFDNHGTMGYRVFSNGVPVAEVRAPIYVSPPLGTMALGATEFSVQAFDSSTNLGPVSPAVRYARWDFHTDGFLDGWWPANHIAAPLVTNGILSFDVTGIDPFLIAQAPEVRGSNFTRVEVRMHNPTASTTAQVFWTTAADGVFDQAKSEVFAITPNDAGFRTYSVNLGGKTNWVGQTITQLRLDPVANVTSGRVEIDYIAIVTTNQPAQPNQPPSFTKGPNIAVLEDAGPQTFANWATAISPGPPAEAWQTVSFLCSNSNPALFLVGPAVSTNGTLIFTSAPDAFGSATVTVWAQDNGGTANGGQDTSAPQTFTITVTPVNDPPSFTKGPDLTVLEDAGPQTNANWATNLSPGPANETGQSFSFTVTNGNSALFATPPAINAQGTLTFRPAANAFGSATVGVRLFDSGGTANGGQNASGWQTFVITILPVNDPPVFTQGPDQRIATNAGQQTVPGWATGISAGATNESTQSLAFLVTNSNPSLFLLPPAISSAGTLTYTPVPGLTGGATVHVRLQDDGGTANGGRDVSASLAFVISVTPDGQPPTPRGGPPNVVLILVDDLGYGDVGVYGQNARFTNGLPAVRTATLDRMAAEGLRFTQFCAAPSCAPARAALMTGLHNGHSAIRANAASVNLRREDPILPELLRAGGYVNGMFGKWGLGEADETAQSPTLAGQLAVGDAQPLRKGFDEFYGYLSHVAAHYSFATDLFTQRGYRLWDTVGTNLVAQEVITNYTQDVFTDRALAFLERHRTNRFFLYLPFTPPHANSSMGRIDAPEIEPEYFDKPWPETEKKFASTITRMDRHIGLILNKLAELGLERDTVVLFTSDNGPHAAGGHDPNFFDSNGPLRDRKFTVYEGGIRVPFIAWSPGRIAPGAVSSHLSAVWDLLPTICDLTGVPSLPGMDGISFAPTLLGNPAAQLSHSHLFWTDDTTGRAVRSNDWKAVRFGTNALELYNLAVDLGEATNVAAANPTVAAQMESLLAASETAPWNPAPPVLAVHPAGPLNFGAVRVGDAPVTLTFVVSNAATGYASLLGGEVAAALTDPRVSAATGGFGPLAAGAVSPPFAVTFDPNTLVPLTNQSLIVTGRLHGFDSPVATNSPLAIPLEAALLPPAPRPIRAIQREASGVSLEVEGVAGLTYQVLASTNLLDWEAIGAQAVGPGGWFNFLDTNAPLLPRRFYRSLWP